MKRLLKKILRLRKVIIGKDFYTGSNISLKKKTLGVDKACWTIYENNLTSGSVVYSFGVGTDISFDLAMIKQYHLTIHAFDPTPKSIQWVKDQNIPPEFIFHPFGLASKN